MIPFKTHIQRSSPYVGGSTRDPADPAKKIHKLSSNENPLGPSPLALRAIKDHLEDLHEYNYQDDSRFREALAKAMGPEIRPDQFITANSGMELLDLICRGFLEPGDEVILSSPTFLAYKNFAATAGATAIDVPLKAKTYALDTDGIIRAAGSKTKILFLSSPNNPTGAIIDPIGMGILLRQLPPQVLVVYDEVYHHYVTHRGYARALKYIQQDWNVIGIHSFSKAYGLAGMRIGYAFSTPAVAHYLQNLRRPFMINTLSMEAGIAALEDHEHLRRTVDLVETEKRWLYQQLNELGITFWPSHANYILFESPYAAPRLAGDMLASGVMVRTGEVFGAPHCVRVTIGTRQANTAFINLLKLLS
jgi:histidinol-phosphate aminotransferase